MPLNTPEKQELLNALLHTNDLHLVVEKASAVLKNPVAVIDGAYQILAKSGTPRKVPDEFWAANTEGARWNYDLVARVNKLIDSHGNPLSQPMLLTGVGESRRRLESLVQDDVFLGFMCALEVETPLEEGSEENYALVREVLAKALAMHRALRFHSRAGHAEGILTDLFNNRFNDRLLFRERIRGEGFDEQYYFRIYVIDLAGYAPKTDGGGLEANLRKIFGRHWSISEQEHIIVLVAFDEDPDQRTGAGKPKLDAKLRDFLLAHKLTAGKSPVFSDLFTAPMYRQLALRALQLSRELASTPLRSRERVLFDYEDYKLPNLLAQIPPGRIGSYCSREIQQIREHDREHGTEYLKTIFHYLHSGRSINHASKILFVHPNTVQYRVNKAKELFGLNFTCEYRNLLYHLSCIMLLYSGRERQPGKLP